MPFFTILLHSPNMKVKSLQMTAEGHQSRNDLGFYTNAHFKVHEIVHYLWIAFSLYFVKRHAMKTFNRIYISTLLAP